MSNSNNNKLLNILCKRDHLEVQNFSFDDHPDIDCNEITKGSWRSALSLACEYGFFKLAKELIAKPGIEINSPDKLGFTPLMYASRNGYTAIVDLLLDHKRIYINAFDHSGFTALHWACSRGHAGVVRLLVEDPRIDINKVSNDGVSVMHSFPDTYDPDEYVNIIRCLKVILASGKMVDIMKKMHNGETPYKQAHNANLSTLVELFDDYLSDPRKTSIRLRAEVSSWPELSFDYDCMKGSEYRLISDFENASIDPDDNINPEW